MAEPPASHVEAPLSVPGGIIATCNAWGTSSY